jgi:hypothetical protein
LILEFVAECQRQGRVPKSYDPQTRIFVFGRGADGDVKVQLDNLFRAWLALREEAGRDHLADAARASGHPRNAALP